jgi:SagB-type dehydrogenase family enzyme
MLSYHEETKHSELSVRSSTHHLDWTNRPSSFKVYKNLPSVPLPRDFAHPSGDSLVAIKGVMTEPTERSVNLKTVAEFLFFSAGLTRRVEIPSGPIYMRAASATGALYPIELYVVSGDLPGLEAGVYHFNPLSFALIKIREGDFRPELGRAFGKDSMVSPVAFVFTSLAWRNAWKYEVRSYRHWFWDSGVIGANLLATAASECLPAKLAIGFVDADVDRLLGLKRGKEATVAIAPIGIGRSEASLKEKQDVPEISPDYEPLSVEEVDYPSMWKANKASSLFDLAEVENWRRSLTKSLPKRDASTQFRHKLSLLGRGAPVRPLSEVILRRGSTRRFARKEIDLEQLSTILDTSSSDIPLDFLHQGETLVDFYLIANAVRGLPSGSYHFDRADGSLEQLKEGQFRTMSAYLCLEQPLFGDASAVLFLMTDLDHVISSLGERGYRAGQFEAGVRAGKVYLSSYSLEIGASGSTFYDDAVTEFFSPHAKGKSTMIAVGVGVPAYRARPGTVLPQA